MRIAGIFLAILMLCGCDRAKETTADQQTAAQAPDFGERWRYPREREIDGRRVIVHAPQIRSWDDFEHFTAQVAVEFLEKDATARYGVIDLSGDTAVDLEERLVRVAKPKVDRVIFTDVASSPEQETHLRAALEREPLEIPLDIFLFHLADGVIEAPPPEGFNTDPPPIHVVETPAFLLFINGEPVAAAIAGTGIETIVNANFPTFLDTASGRYYLLSGKHRYSSATAAGPWGTVKELPAGFAKIPAKGELASIAAVVATPPAEEIAPRVITTFKPAEIVVLDGKPQAEEIPGTGGLASITNTESPLFKLDDQYYLLISGRWFSTPNLQKGPWKFTQPLPEAFAMIPPDHAAADVRASVPGTLEARRAALEAMLPVKKQAKAGAAPKVAVNYAGEPKFEPIPETEVARAANTNLDIIEHGGKYYLLYEGVWYVASKATGPWAATGDVPAAIYKIPPSSPSYPVTQVTAEQVASGTIIYQYPPSYSSGVYVSFGVAYYGTGWYYPPYAYGGYYYPYYGSYGHGSWYNPNTGGYGSRSVYYGPYGGYSYSQGYNPTTGRYGAVETAWDGDEWASSGGTYNPRTGISTQTDRHYSEDSNKMKMERTAEGARGNEMDVTKETDFDTGTRTTTRETSRGGSSEFTHQRNADGSISSSGTIEGAGGGSGSIERERDASGVTREGSFSKDGQTVNTETRRQGDKSVTKAEGSGGGRAVSASGDSGRTTIAESGSGDLYAGHNGEVFKKTDDGWQKHGEDGWQDVQKPERPDAGEGNGNFSRDQLDASSRDAARTQATQAGGQGQPGDRAAQNGAGATPRYGGSGSLGGTGSQTGQRSQDMGGGAQARPSYQNYDQLNRDSAARRGGNSEFSAAKFDAAVRRHATPARSAAAMNHANSCGVLMNKISKGGLFALLFILSSAAISQDTSTWDGLVQVKPKRLDAAYILPGADFRPYTKVMLDPAEVAFHKDWMKNLNRSTRELSSRVTQEDADRIVAAARDGFAEVFAETFKEKGLEIVTTSGPDVLRIRPGVVDLYVTAPDLQTASRSRTYTTEAGQATLFLELRDSTTGALLGRALDRKATRDTGRAMVSNSVTNRSDFEALFRKWANIAVQGFEDLHAMSPVPEDLQPGQKLQD